MSKLPSEKLAACDVTTSGKWLPEEVSVCLGCMLQEKRKRRVLLWRVGDVGLIAVYSVIYAIAVVVVLSHLCRLARTWTRNRTRAVSKYSSTGKPCWWVTHVALSKRVKFQSQHSPPKNQTRQLIILQFTSQKGKTTTTQDPKNSQQSARTHAQNRPWRAVRPRSSKAGLCLRTDRAQHRTEELSNYMLLQA